MMKGVNLYFTPVLHCVGELGVGGGLGSSTLCEVRPCQLLVTYCTVSREVEMKWDVGSTPQRVVKLCHSRRCHTVRAKRIQRLLLRCKGQ